MDTLERIRILLTALKNETHGKFGNFDGTEDFEEQTTNTPTALKAATNQKPITTHPDVQTFF